METVQNIAKKFQNNNKNLYIVGGFCRDRILNIHNSETDIDFTTDALPEETQNIVNCIAHVGNKYWTQIVYEEWKSYEITTFRSDIGILDNRKPVSVEFTDDIKLDALRRDFTCNAIYFDPMTEEYIDPTWGMNDLSNNIIRFVWDPEMRIKEDALRILRFIRFKNTYNFFPAENNYFTIIKKHISLLKNISKERIKDELDKILLLPNNIQALKDLKEIGFFTVFLTEIEKQSDTPGSKYHQEWNVWIHTLMTIEYLNKINSSPIKTAKLDLLRAMLLHDIAKPICYSEDSYWNGHYYWHERSWAEMIKNDIFSELPFSKKSQHKIIWITENHLRIFKVFEMRALKSRSLMMHKYWPDLMIIWESDHMGRIPTSYDLIKKLHQFYSNFLNILTTKSFLTGEDILKKYPSLQWWDIWKKLQDVNNQILINDLK
jgi:tRNA nucleotidyltransferase (CCA-adding enzyme)